MVSHDNIQQACLHFEAEVLSSAYADKVREIKDGLIRPSGDTAADEFVQNHHAIEVYNALRQACKKFRPNLYIAHRNKLWPFGQKKRYALFTIPDNAFDSSEKVDCTIILGADLPLGDRAFALVKEATHFLLLEEFAKSFGENLSPVFKALDPVESETGVMMQIGCRLLYDRPDPVSSNDILTNSAFMPDKLRDQRIADLQEMYAFQEQLTEYQRAILRLVWLFERKAARLAVRLLVPTELQQSRLIAETQQSEDAFLAMSKSLQSGGLSKSVADIITYVNFDFSAAK